MPSLKSTKETGDSRFVPGGNDRTKERRCEVQGRQAARLLRPSWWCLVEEFAVAPRKPVVDAVDDSHADE